MMRRAIITFAVLAAAVAVAVAAVWYLARLSEPRVRPRGGPNGRTVHPGRVNVLRSLLPAARNLGAKFARGPEQFFGPENLSEKINGGNEAYLQRGFVGLACVSFTSRDDANQIVELFIYRMSNPQAAKSIFQYERPEPNFRTDLNLGDEAYLAAGSIFLRKGSYYLRVVCSSDTPEMRRLVRGLAEEVLGRLSPPR